MGWKGSLPALVESLEAKSKTTSGISQSSWSPIKSRWRCALVGLSHCEGGTCSQESGGRQSALGQGPLAREARVG